MNPTTYKDNLLAHAWRGFKSATGSPLGASLLLGAAAGVGTRLLWRPALETARSLARPLAAAAGRGAELDEAIDDAERNGAAKTRLPLATGMLTAAGLLGLLYNKRYRNGGLLSWDSPYTGDLSAFRRDPKTAGLRAADGAVAELRKTAALDKRAFGMESYVQQMDWGRRVPLREARSLFTDDPFLPTGDRYAMNMGTAIVTDAAARQRTTQPTLGGIFDAAAGKIGGKLSLAGVADVGTKAMVANGAARLFTGAIGAVLGLGPTARKNLIDAGTWAGTVSAILD